MIRRPPRSTPLYSSAASDVYKRQALCEIRVIILIMSFVSGELAIGCNQGYGSIKQNGTAKLARMIKNLCENKCSSIALPLIESSTEIKSNKRQRFCSPVCRSPLLKLSVIQLRPYIDRAEIVNELRKMEHCSIGYKYNRKNYHLASRLKRAQHKPPEGVSKDLLCIFKNRLSPRKRRFETLNLSRIIKSSMKENDHKNKSCDFTK
eukprot:TRINITY_DN1964_c0_g1_i8.p1 TRINITY_DN1964_c0_g1~~TRINITY_DN1964_c0_g1_i8.p1  ORF type:complete len:215 (-),score=33.34 TRINITY_DN1964_c0_g1_i8:344-961(-)